MGYMHIDNLYKDRRIFDFAKCYALLKVHGTSANISFKDNNLHFFSGGAKHTEFVALFDTEDIKSKFIEIGHDNIVVYGEAYGGKMQGMSKSYGTELRFIVFDVAIDDKFVSVPIAEKIAIRLGLEFVPYKLIDVSIDNINAERDKPDELSIRRGITEPRKSEGVVLRPITEYVDHRGNRVITKHKNDDFIETKTKRELTEQDLKVLSDTQDIVDEWVTPMRLTHVLDKFPDASMEQIPKIIDAMYEDVVREAANEIVITPQLRKFIGNKTARLFKMRLQASLC